MPSATLPQMPSSLTSSAGLSEGRDGSELGHIGDILVSS